MAECWYKGRNSHPPFYMTASSCGHVRSRVKLKTLYLHSDKRYGQQTWQDVELGWGFLSTKSNNRLITKLREVTLQKRNIYLHLHNVYDHQTR